MELHYFAAARAARGQATETIRFTGTVAELIARLSEHPGTTESGLSFAKVLQRCTLLIDGTHATNTTHLQGHERVDVLPPFAGG